MPETQAVTLTEAQLQEAARILKERKISTTKERTFYVLEFVSRANGTSLPNGAQLRIRKVTQRASLKTYEGKRLDDIDPKVEIGSPHDYCWGERTTPQREFFSSPALARAYVADHLRGVAVDCEGILWRRTKELEQAKTRLEEARKSAADAETIAESVPLILD